MRPPRDFLAHPPKRRRSVSFNTTLSVLREEIQRASEELAKLTPEDGEITFRVKAEARVKRSVEKEALNVQVTWAIEAIEDGKR